MKVKPSKKKVSSTSVPPTYKSSCPVSKGSGSNDVVRIRDQLDSIPKFKKQILSSKKHLNLLLNLLEIFESTNLEVKFTSLKAIQHILISYLKRDEIVLYKKLAADGKEVVGMEKTPAQLELETWLSSIYKTWFKKLLGLLAHKEVTLQVVAVDCCLSLIKEDSYQGYRQQSRYVVNLPNLLSLVETLLYSETLSPVSMEHLVVKYVNAYMDIRYYFLKATSQILTQHFQAELPDSHPTLSNNVYLMLIDLTNLNEEKVPFPFYFYDVHHLKGTKPGEPHFLLGLAVYKKVFQEAWLQFLKFKLDRTTLKQVLLQLPKRVLVHFTNPLTLLDFLTDAYDAGGPIALLALQGLFLLMQNYRAEYPNFYWKLYQQLTPNLLHLKFRSRFFRLMAVFLSSSHISATLIAAFIKRLARLALSAPPGAIVIVLPLIYNLLQSHPACMVLIHRSQAVQGGEVDRYDFYQPDPIQSNALHSSLWELKALEKHYYPNLATLALTFQEKFTKPNFQLEDFLDHNYHSMLEVEFTKPFKKVPPLATSLPKSILKGESAVQLSQEWEF